MSPSPAGCKPKAEGRRARQKKGAPRVLAKSQTHQCTYRQLLSLAFWFGVFLGVLGVGSSKTPLKDFCNMSMSKTFPQKINKHFDVSFPSTFYRVFGWFSAMGVQKRYKKLFAEKSSRKVFTKKSTTDFFYHVLGRFSVRGVPKHDKKYRQKKSDPGPFLACDPPTHHHGGHRFFLPAPCASPFPRRRVSSSSSLRRQNDKTPPPPHLLGLG
jgi:hypothetical protein